MGHCVLFACCRMLFIEVREGRILRCPAKRILHWEIQRMTSASFFSVPGQMSGSLQQQVTGTTFPPALPMLLPCGRSD